MALQNQIGIYQGAAPLNSLPFVNIALQQRARKQAREQAIDQYYQKLPDTINDKGIRDQEIPIINEYKNKIFEYGYKNKEALRKGDGAAQLGLQQLVREAQSVARESQDLGRRGLERGKMYLSKEGRWAVDDDEFMAAEEAESQPLYMVKDGQIVRNPSHNKMDMVGLLSNRPFDEKEFGKELQSKVKYGTKTQTTNDPDNPLYDIVSEIPSLDESAKGKIYAFGAEKLHGNRRFEDFIKKKTPEQLQILGQIYKDTYGKEPTEDEDYAAGYVISQLPIQSIKQKRPQDTDAVMDKRAKTAAAEWDRRNKITFGQSMQKIAANKAAGQVPDNLGYVSDEVVSEYGVPLQSGKTFVDITNVDPERIDIITNRDLSKKKLGVAAVEIDMKQPDGSLKRMKGYYVDPATGDWEGKGGQKVSREAAKDRYIQSKAGTKFKAQSGTKGSENTKQKPKKDPLGLF